MRLSQYSDDEIIEELKHRGIKVELLNLVMSDLKVKIGGVVFDLI